MRNLAGSLQLSIMKSNSKLLPSLREGDPEAFRKLYDSCYQKASSAVLKSGGTSEDAEDIFQEALFVLLKQLRSPDFHIEAQLSSWLYSVCRNLWLKKLRDRNPEVIGIDDEKWGLLQHSKLNSPEKKDEHEEQAQLALQKLSEECRAVILLAYCDGLHDRVIAQQLGYQYDTVRVKRFRCMKRLRNIFHQIQSQ